MDRRLFLGACIGMLGVAPWWAAPAPRILRVVRADDGEAADVLWFDGRSVVQSGYERLCWLLRDAHVAPAHGDAAIAPKLIQVLWEIQRAHELLGHNGRLVIHSGYRTIETNANTEGAVLNSQHIAGDACDFHVEGVPIHITAQLSRHAPLRGGCGEYERGGGDGWVHVDIAGLRNWSG
ncbi:MAG: YcbK family protein [Vulcanimicrobiaceae bacterium]